MYFKFRKAKVYNRTSKYIFKLYAMVEFMHKFPVIYVTAQQVKMCKQGVMGGTSKNPKEQKWQSRVM